MATGITRGFDARVLMRAQAANPTRERASFGDALRIVVPFVLLTLGCLLAKPGLLRIVFPAATCLFGYRLYRKHEVYFLSFLLWIYMLAPLLRRLVDWKTSYQEQSYVLLAPLLATLIPAIDLHRRFRTVAPVVRQVTLLAFAGIAYGFGIGCIKHPGAQVLLAAATWIAPIVLCIFAASVREREELGRVITRTFLFGVLGMALYGVYQFVVAPPWDSYWLKMISAGAASIAPSFGQPQPFAIRVWSTMNAPGPFAVFLSAALIWLASRTSLSSFIVSLAGYSALLLTLVRSAWLSTGIGLLVLILGSKSRLPLKAFVATSLILTVLVVGVQQMPKAEDIKQRIQTFSNLRNDGSANERKDLYSYMATVTLATPAGNGLDNRYEVHGYPLDSSIIVLFYALGWTGAACYLAALLKMSAHALLYVRGHLPHSVAAASIVLSIVMQLASGDVLFRQGGLLLWLFFGAGVRLSIPTGAKDPDLHVAERWQGSPASKRRIPWFSERAKEV